MRPGGDVLGARPRKDLETAVPTTPPSSGTPISFFMATEKMLERPIRQPITSGSLSAFGVGSLQETVYIADTNIHDQKSDSDSQDDRKFDGRRRSTIKPVYCDQRGSPECLGKASQAKVGDASPIHSSNRQPSPPGTSESMTSLSQIYQVQGLSLPSSPKSASTRSSRPSDEESMDEVASQAIISSDDEEDLSISELQDSAPQLIMPSIKMPSRRPFTERGKEMGRLKILIAGDSGMSC